MADTPTSGGEDTSSQSTREVSAATRSASVRSSNSSSSDLGAASLAVSEFDDDEILDESDASVAAPLLDDDEPDGAATLTAVDDARVDGDAEALVPDTDELELFRAQWRQELYGQAAPPVTAPHLIRARDTIGVDGAGVDGDNDVVVDHDGDHATNNESLIAGEEQQHHSSRHVVAVDEDLEAAAALAEEEEQLLLESWHDYHDLPQSTTSSSSRPSSSSAATSSEEEAAISIALPHGKDKLAHAKALFDRAVLEEHKGHLIYATSLYRAAFKLNPLLDKWTPMTVTTTSDAPSRARPPTNAPQATPATPASSSASSTTAPSSSSSSSTSTTGAATSSLATTASILPKWAHDFARVTDDEPFDASHCTPDQPLPSSNIAHISHLPAEAMVRLFSFLDAVSLERVGRCCRRWFVLSREKVLWKELCRQQWPLDWSASVSAYHMNWRRMYIARPRPRLDGIYISKNHYFRTGQTEGTYYQPVFQVEYYRYLRFYPDGTVVAIVSPEQPKVVASFLSRNESTIEQGAKRKYEIQIGSFRSLFADDQPGAHRHDDERDAEDDDTEAETLALTRHYGRYTSPQIGIRVSEYRPSRYSRTMHMTAEIVSHRRGWLNRIVLLEYFSTRQIPDGTPVELLDLSTDPTRCDFAVHNIRPFVFVPYLGD